MSKEIDFTKPLWIPSKPKFKVEFLRVVNNYCNNRNLVIITSEENIEWSELYSDYGEQAFYSHGKIENKPEKPKFDPTKPCKFAKEGCKSKPVFLGYCNQDNDSKYKLIYKYKMISRSNGNIYDQVSLFTINGFFHSCNDESVHFRSELDLINIEE